MAAGLGRWFQGRRKARAYPPAPRGEVVYIIGDIHGRLDCLLLVHALIDEDSQRYAHKARIREIYLGDMIDRGPQSAGVLEALITRAAKHEAAQRDLVWLKGNHERAMEDFLTGTMDADLWKRYGGAATLLSYGLDSHALQGSDHALRQQALLAIPQAHMDFLAAARPFFVVGDYCCVHAGLRPGVALRDQTLEDMTTIRDDFLEWTGDMDYIVIHGHTPVPQVDFRANRINVDTGAYATNRLSVIRIDESGPAVVRIDTA
jgi:serine/threonine protein phosphatase 1